jgi:hypothetical protein
VAIDLLDTTLGGFIGAVAARLLATPSQVRSHNRLIRERDASLWTWVQDEDVRLKRELRGLTNALAAEGQLYAGATPAPAGIREGTRIASLARRKRGSPTRRRCHTPIRDAWSPMPRLTVLHDPKLIAIVEEWKADVEVARLSPEPVVDPDERLPEGSRATDDPPRGLLD